MSFGDKLMQLLEDREISQKDFAAALNIAPSTVNGYIKNKRQPDFDLIRKMAKILDVSTDFLLDYNGTDINLSAKELSLIFMLRKMDEKQQEMLYTLAKITTGSL